MHNIPKLPVGYPSDSKYPAFGRLSTERYPDVGAIGVKEGNAQILSIQSVNEFEIPESEMARPPRKSRRSLPNHQLLYFPVYGSH